MLKQILAAALVATSAFGSLAEDHDTMYLIKDNHVVGKYKVADVDYASFTLPEGVEDSNISATLDSKGKNTVTYTITTVNPTIAYAHNLLSFYEVDYMAQDMFGDYFNNLPDESKLLTIQYALSYNAYVGIGTRQYTQTDYELDGTGADSRFNVLPGTHYFLCAWEVDPIEQTPLETFVYSEFDTDAPGESTATIDCSLVEKLEQGAHLSITGSGLKYVVTCWGVRSVMDAYAEMLGVDYLLGMFGQKWDLDFLQGSGDLGEGIPNSIWPLNGSGAYVMYARAYDADGNCTTLRKEIDVDEAEVNAGPEITIFSKSLTADGLSVNFEISPSNVEEAYVRLCGENWTDDRLNIGYELYELAMGGDSEDITEAINTAGEYTFRTSDLGDEEWKNLLIYAKDADGNRSVIRLCFFPDANDPGWIVRKAPAKKIAPVKRIHSKRNPTIPRG